MTETHLRVFPSIDTLSLAAADQFTQTAKEAVVRRGRFLVALSGGNTPRILYHLLTLPLFVRQLPWSRMHLFWGDERCVPPEDPESNFGQAGKTWLSRAPLPEQNIHPMRGEKKAAQAALDYAMQLKAFAKGRSNWPRFDLVLLGLGVDGHTASLFPNSPVKIDSKLAVAAVKANVPGRPAERITLTANVFNKARQVIFLVSGEEKAGALEATLKGRRDPLRWPAQRIHPPDGQVWWFVDAAAAGQLPVTAQPKP